jgi:hypothetical protein
MVACSRQYILLMTLALIVAKSPVILPLLKPQSGLLVQTLLLHVTVSLFIPSSLTNQHLSEFDTPFENKKKAFSTC